MTSPISPTVIPAPAASTSDRALVILSHLSAMLGVPLLLPFIVWLVKRHDGDTVAAHAAEALNFHLSLIFYTICLIPLCVIVVGIPLLIVMGIASVILAIVAAMKASDGQFFRYPLTIRLVR